MLEFLDFRQSGFVVSGFLLKDTWMQASYYSCKIKATGIYSLQKEQDLLEDVGRFGRFSDIICYKDRSHVCPIA